MPVKENVDVIIYRVKDRGLEVFLVNHEQAGQSEHWKAFQADEEAQARLREAKCIELEPVTGADGETRQAIAIEADWHDFPSLRALIYEDYRVAKEKAKQRIRDFIPDMDKGTYFAVKEAIKKVMPEQYQFLKELKDILLEKNQAKYV